MTDTETKVETPVAEEPKVESTDADATKEKEEAQQRAPTGSLYVGDLHPDVTEQMLFDLFRQVGNVSTVRVCREAVTRRSLCYAYVNFSNLADAERAMDTLNFAPVLGQAIRIMWSHRDPSLRKSGKGNIFIKNLDPAIDNKAMYDTFSTFGKIMSCKVATDDNGDSKGYGYVHYETAEAAELAIKKVHGKKILSLIVSVTEFVPKRSRKDDGPKWTNLYVKNLDETVSDAELMEYMSLTGPVTSAVIMRDENGGSKGFGFVNFENASDAMQAAELFNGMRLRGTRRLYAGRAQKKDEREKQLRTEFEERRRARAAKYQDVNLYVKNLDDGIDDDRLRQEFAQFGTITSAKVMRDEKGMSKGFGFVCFTTPEEAMKAITRMNGFMLGQKPLYVALAQRKEMRSRNVDSFQGGRGQFMGAGFMPGMNGQQMAPGMVPPQGFPGVPAPGMYPGMQQPVFYPNQGRPGPRGPGFMYPQGMGQQMGRGGWNQPNGNQMGYKMPNYVVPVAQRNQRGAGRGGQRMPQQGAPAGQAQSGQQQSPTGRNRGYKFTATARNRDQPQQQVAPGASMAQGGVFQGMNPDQQQQAAMLTQMLAQAAPEQQKQILGERLYPAVQQLHGDAMAGKLTGMLLEMDNSEILHLLESPDALRSKVQEAVQVLDTHTDEPAAAEAEAVEAEAEA